MLAEGKLHQLLEAVQAKHLVSRITDQLHASAGFCNCHNLCIRLPMHVYFSVGSKNVHSPHCVAASTMKLEDHLVVPACLVPSATRSECKPQPALIVPEVDCRCIGLIWTTCW